MRSSRYRRRWASSRRASPRRASPRPASPGRAGPRWASLLALLLAVTGTLAVTAGTATAAPRPLAAPGDSGDDGEGGSKSLVEQLEAASRGFLEARDALQNSRKRQRQLVTRLKQIDAEVGPRQAALADIANQSYRVGRLGPMRAIVNASSTGDLLDRAATLERVALNTDSALRDLLETRRSQQQAKVAIDAAIRDQQKHLNAMAKRKAQAENALKVANAGADADAPGDGGGDSASADPAPRNSDGSLDDESCSRDDPTGSGCLTPRMLHALNEAKSDGFTRFVKCFREQNSGEHPKGRACDFAADRSSFGGVATGSSKTYGDRLANYLIDNSDRLAVLYVIWFKRIWLPSSGWKSYTAGNGDASSDHTNHVHLSVR